MILGLSASFNVFKEREKVPLNVDENEFINCPYCWQQLEIIVDCTYSQQTYTEDCHVCCRPIRFDIEVDDEKRPEIRVSMDES